MSPGRLSRITGDPARHRTNGFDRPQAIPHIRGRGAPADGVVRLPPPDRHPSGISCISCRYRTNMAHFARIWPPRRDSRYQSIASAEGAVRHHPTRPLSATASPAEIRRALLRSCCAARSPGIAATGNRRRANGLPPVIPRAVRRSPALRHAARATFRQGEKRARPAPRETLPPKRNAASGPRARAGTPPRRTRARVPPAPPLPRGARESARPPRLLVSASVCLPHSGIP